MAKTEKKKIGILTSGGDCAGLNAVIRAATHAAREKGWDVVGILDSTDGLMARPFRTINLDSALVDGATLRSGGTMLGTTSKGSHSPLNYPMPDGKGKDRSHEVAEAYQQLGLSGLVVVGGDGSMAILREISRRTNGAVQFVGVPKTIDNDVGATEVAVGFDTAVAVATEALDRLQPTAASHQRVMILEVMGRDAGHIALCSGIAGGADVILLPEIPYDVTSVCAKINKLRESGRMHSLIVVSEAAKMIDGDKLMTKQADGKLTLGGAGQQLAHILTKETGAETRVTVLGHVQRGAAPNANDRLIATAMGAHAVELLAKGAFERMVIWKNRQVTSVPLDQALERYNSVAMDDTLLHTARVMGICLGEPESVAKAA